MTRARGFQGNAGILPASVVAKKIADGKLAWEPAGRRRYLEATTGQHKFDKLRGVMTWLIFVKNSSR
jgi:hypothetical protein